MMIAHPISAHRYEGRLLSISAHRYEGRPFSISAHRYKGRQKQSAKPRTFYAWFCAIIAQFQKTLDNHTIFGYNASVNNVRSPLATDK